MYALCNMDVIKTYTHIGHHASFYTITCRRNPRIKMTNNSQHFRNLSSLLTTMQQSVQSTGTVSVLNNNNVCTHTTI